MKFFRTFSKNSLSRDMTLSFVTFVMLPSIFCSQGRENFFLGIVANTTINTPFYI